MYSHYRNAVSILTSQEKFHICLGLDRISQILDILGNPQDSLNIVHVAGTNGKGSVSAILNAILSEAGYKTGLYTSPHLLKYTERIKINNKNIPDDEFADLIFRICDTAKKNDVYLTEFEVLTAATFLHFAQNKTDICIIETGLGGRFDATNVIKKNLLSVITSISLDHTERLGDSIEKIAFEKAGIIKSGSPVVCSPSNAGFEVIQEQAQLKNTGIITPAECVKINFRNGKNYAVTKHNEYEFSLLGLYQKQNLELALEACKNLKDFTITPESVRTGLKKVNWSCRLQYAEKYNLILDGAHNPDGCGMLKESLDYYFPEEKRIFIYGTLKNKDYEKSVKTLFREEDTVYLYDFKHANHACFKEISQHLKQKAVPADISKIRELLQDDGLKIIAGSIYMIGEILENITELDNIY